MPLPPNTVDTVCMESQETMDEGELPPDTVTITTSSIVGDEATFTVTVDWDGIEALAVQSGLDDCEVNKNVQLGNTFEFSGTCTEGYVGVTVVAYMGGEFDEDECDACSVSDIAELTGNVKFCAHRIEIPCDQQEVECGEPSAQPSGSYFPSSAPSDAPTKSPAPSDSPTESPSASPTGTPTGSPSNSPTASPSASPTESPSGSPSNSPTASPSESPTASPSGSPSGSPTGSPSESPTGSPSASPSESPTGSPSASPSGSPTESPSDSPTVSPSASPSESPRQECPEGQAELVANDGETMYADLPIEIREANG